MKAKEQEALRQLLEASSNISSGFSIVDTYPSLEWLHTISGMKKTIREIVGTSNRIIDPIIEEHKHKKKPDNKEEDLVDILLKFHINNVDKHEFSLTTNNIKADVLELFAGGAETSSTTLEWAMSEIIKNPRVMEKAQDEVRQVYQAQGVVDETKLDELKYLKLVIKETLRLHPPLPLLLPRESIDNCLIHGYDIPPTTRVVINAWTIGRDPEYWSKPDKFFPERFENSSIDYKGTHFEFIPFGAGRRICPGMALGIANVHVTLAKLLYHFDWKLPSTIKRPEDLDMDESFGVSMRRKNDLLVIPILHS